MSRIFRIFTLFAAVTVVVVTGCSLSLQNNLPGEQIAADRVIGMLESTRENIETNKQIFKVRLLDKGRTFSGDGALVFRAPDTLQLSIYGPPFTTLWMQLLAEGDSVTAVLPKEKRVIKADRRDSDRVSNLAGSRGLTDGEFLGGVTGIFPVNSFKRDGMSSLASKDTDGLYHLRFYNDWLAYEFVYDTKIKAVIKFDRYEDGKISREILRSDFREVEGFMRPQKTVYRDFFDDREITVLVNKEQINIKLNDKSFNISVPPGSQVTGGGS